MNVSELNRLPGVHASTLLNKDQIHIELDNNYKVSSIEEVYTQESKKIAFSERFCLGRLMGYGRVNSFFMALFTSLKEQENTTSYYLKRLNEIKISDYFNKIIELYKKQSKSRDQIEDEIYEAYFGDKISSHVSDSYFQHPQPLFNVSLVALYNLKLMKFSQDTHHITIERDCHCLYTIFKISMRTTPYALFGGGTKLKECDIYPALLEIPNGLAFQEAKKIETKMLEILGFKKVQS